MSLNNITARVSTPKNAEVKINKTDGYLQTTAPLSLRNATRDSTFIDKLESINNVTVINRVDGSGLQYNSETQNYEIKLMTLDGGHF